MAYTIENRPDALVLRVPLFQPSARYYWIPLLAVAIFAIIEGLLRQPTRSQLWDFCLLLVAILNCAVAYGERSVVVDGEFVTQTENYWGFVIVNRKMPVQGISNLRYVDVRPWSFIPKPQGLALDFEGREKRLASRLEKGEVEAIISAVRDRFPALR